MNQVRIIALLLLLLSGNSFGFAIPAGIDPGSFDNDNAYHFTEDYQDLSYSHLETPLDLNTQRIPVGAVTVPVLENTRETSRSKSYFSRSFLIEPGLGLEDIIFPFHTFL